MTDVDTLMKYWNNASLRQFLMNHFPHAREEEEEWIRSTWQSKQQGRAYTFGILTEEDVLIGTCGIGSISPIHHSANLGISIFDSNYWGKGFGTDAMITLCAIGFEVANLNRIQLEVHAFNERAIKVYAKVGFTQIGRKRQCYYINGEYRDAILMDILRDEFYKAYTDINLMERCPWQSNLE